MLTPPRTHSPRPHWAARDLEARFAALDHLTHAGLGSELVEHVLFGELGLCTCGRCRYREGQAA